MKLPKLDRCVRGGVYKLDAYLLKYGVYDGNGAFVGIVEYHDQQYLQVEYHRECERRGSIVGARRIGTLPVGIMTREYVGYVDHVTQRLVEFDRPIAEGGKGWYFVDNGESSPNICPIKVVNVRLFEFMLEFEKKKRG